MGSPRRLLSLLAVAALLLTLGGGAVALTRGTGPDRVAFLARADNPVDALAASSVAAQLGGVVLLTDRAALSPEAAGGLTSFDPDLVVLAGGAAALSPEVEAAVTELGFATQRVAGDSRLSTAGAIAAFLADHDPAYLPADGTAVRALQADTATSATSADTAGSATTAATAVTATTAADAQALGGLPVSAFGPIWTTSAQSDVTLPGGILTLTPVLTLTVTAPTDGMLSVSAGAVVSGGNAVTSLGCELAVDGAGIPGSGLGVTDAVLGVQTGSCAGAGAVAVAAGEHQVRLGIRIENSGFRVTNRNIVVTFSPNGAALPPG